MHASIDHDEVLIEQRARTQHSQKRSVSVTKHAKFSCGDHLTFAGYCVATMYFCIQVKEPTELRKLPVFLDEYDRLLKFNSHTSKLPECLTIQQYIAISNKIEGSQ